MIKMEVVDLTQNNPSFKTNAIIFGILALIFEIVMSFLYGYFVTEFKTDYESLTAPLSLFLLVLLLLVGFGLLNTYIKTTAWSGMGYTLLITSVSVQLYFLMNAFYTKLQVQNSKESFAAGAGWPYISLNYLAEYYGSVNNGGYIYGANFMEAIKCAIAGCIAFSALIGRVGPAEVFFLSLSSVVGYQLNVQVLKRINCNEQGGSMTIFVYGASLGLVASLILGRKETTVSHPKFESTRESRVYTLIGAAFVWALLPCIIFNMLQDFYPTPFLSSGPISVWFALASAGVTSFCVSVLIHNKIRVEDVVFGTLSGGISFLTCSGLIFYPVAAVSAGILTSSVNTLILSGARNSLNKNGVVCSSPLVQTFLIGGIAGGIYSAIVCAAYGGYYTFTIFQYTFPTDTDGFKQGGLQIAGTFISVGIGAILGIISGIFMRLINRNSQEDQFDDGVYWTIEDYGLKDQSQNSTRH